MEPHSAYVLSSCPPGPLPPANATGLDGLHSEPLNPKVPLFNEVTGPSALGLLQKTKSILHGVSVEGCDMLWLRI